MPEIDGGVEFEGATGTGCTTPVAAEFTGPAEPALFVATTATRIVDPTSPATTVYAEFVSPARATHEAPDPSQRNHWYANVGAGCPDHTPGSATNT